MDHKIYSGQKCEEEISEYVKKTFLKLQPMFKHFFLKFVGQKGQIT
jgi:hypothetical protein